MSVDPKLLRSVLGTFATGVTIVTARDEEGGAHGLTANSFTSVSLDPPLVLWCLGDRSDSYKLFASAPAYAVNILEAGDEARAMRFAGKGDQQVREEECSEAVTGAPILHGILASLDCEVVQRITAGDHLILIGEVKAVSIAEGDGLTYFRSRFGRASSPVTA